jgi:hypothetical protein
MYTFMKNKIWETRETEIIHKPPGGDVIDGYGFVYKSPTGFLRTYYGAFSHYPVLFFRQINLYIQFPYKYVTRVPIKDSDIFNVITLNSLILLTHIDETGNNLTFSLDQSTFPEFIDRPNVNIKTLNIVFEIQTKKIVYAGSSKGPITDNEIIMYSLIEIVGNYVHTDVHIYAEMCAGQIEYNGIDILKSSMYFTRALHNALLNGKTSPLSETSSFRFTTEESKKYGVKMHATNPTLVYFYDDRKKQFPYYKWYVESRKVTYDLIKKYNIATNLKNDVSQETFSENFFRGTVVHAPDHYGLYEALKNIIYSQMNKNTIGSYWTGHVFINFWLKPVNNIFNSERIRDEKSQFYQELYKEICTIDKKRADQMMCSTSF